MFCVLEGKSVQGSCQAIQGLLQSLLQWCSVFQKANHAVCIAAMTAGQGAASKGARSFGQTMCSRALGKGFVEVLVNVSRHVCEFGYCSTVKPVIKKQQRMPAKARCVWSKSELARQSSLCSAYTLMSDVVDRWYT